MASGRFRASDGQPVPHVTLAEPRSLDLVKIILDISVKDEVNIKLMTSE